MRCCKLFFNFYWTFFMNIHIINCLNSNIGRVFNLIQTWWKDKYARLILMSQYMHISKSLADLNPTPFKKPRFVTLFSFSKIVKSWMLPVWLKLIHFFTDVLLRETQTPVRWCPERSDEESSRRNDATESTAPWRSWKG